MVNEVNFNQDDIKLIDDKAKKSFLISIVNLIVLIY